MSGLTMAAQAVTVAQVVTWGSFSLVSFTTLAGMVEGVRPGTLGQVGTWALGRLMGALRALGAFLTFLNGVRVTYLHMYRGARGAHERGRKARRMAGFGRLAQRAGQHRRAVWA